MLCPYCGSEIQEGSAYCPMCNAQLSKSPAQEQASEGSYGTQPEYAAGQQPYGAQPTNATGQQPYSAQPASATGQQPYGAQPGFAYPGAMPAGQADTQSTGLSFPNARKGLSNLFTAQAILIGAAVVAVIVAILSFTAVAASGSSGAAGGAVGIVAMVSIVAAVLMLAAFIARLVGLWQAGKDENLFKIAFFVTIGSIVLSVIGALVGSNPTSQSTVTIARGISLLSSLASLAVMILMFRGLVSLMNKINRRDVSSTVNILMIISIICLCASIFVPFAALANYRMASIMAIVAALIACVPDVLLLVALSKGKKAIIKS